MKRLFYCAVLMIIVGMFAGCSYNNAATSTTLAPSTTLGVQQPAATTTTLVQTTLATSTTQTAAAGAKSYTVNIQGFKFSPDSLVIASGDTVVWQNLDSVSHAVISDNGELNSDILPEGGTYSHTFVNKGTFDYYCRIHHAMTGIIIVR